MNAKKQQLICKIEGRAKIKLYSLLRYYRLTVFQLRNGLQIKTFYWLVQQIVLFFWLWICVSLQIFSPNNSSLSLNFTYLEQSERKGMIQSKKNSQ